VIRNDARSLPISLVGRTIPIGLVAAGAVAAIYSLRTAPERLWPALLVDGFYVVSLALSAMFFLSVQRLAGARWSASLRRVPEALMMALPVMSVLLLSVFGGLQTLFPWARPGMFDHAPAIAGKVHYLHAPWIYVRMVGVLVIWSGFAFLFRGISLRQDREPDRSLELHKRLTGLAAVFVPVFALTFTVASFDYVLSVDTQWFSTMFAVYVFAGTFVQGIAAVTLVTVLLKERGPLCDSVSEHQLSDLGKMLFAFSIFWGYIWVCQYLLIWYGNIPDEITHYLIRTNGPWLYVFALNFVLNWVVPFTMLLSAGAKRSATVLKIVSALLLLGHWLDLQLLITPSFSAIPRFGVYEVVIAAGCLALLYIVAAYELRRAPLVPLNDPILTYEELNQAHAAELNYQKASGAEL
jgi:hypothetical protein